MPLATGTKLAHYQIVAPLGAGSMGEVYRALDLKLNRQVAVKLLSGSLADTTARQRFQREAQLASSLSNAKGPPLDGGFFASRVSSRGCLTGIAGEVENRVQG